jgi:hypothetical protein
MRIVLVLALLLGGCQTVTSFLPPQRCKPAVDLPAEKHLAKVPEVETGNQAFYDLLLQERRVHAQDDQDYNSLYSQCVAEKK